MNSEPQFDVVIVGAGPVGCCVAVLLVTAGVVRPERIALLDRQPPPSPTAADPIDLRVFALSRASERILLHVGAWPAIAAQRASPYERMTVWHANVPPRSADVLSFAADEAGEPNLGHIVENRVLQSALYVAATGAGVAFVAGSLQSLTADSRQVELTTSTAALTTRLVVGADGARSQVRTLAGLGLTAADYGQRAIVAVVTSQRPHERTAWQRFLGDGTLALLPLADGRSSIVWSVPDERAARLMALSAQEFAAALTADSDDVLGRLELSSERAAVDLVKQSADASVRERVALVGDAAHVIHPLAGQGVNLGLLDAAALVQVLQDAASDREDPGALRLLRRYERWRRTDNQIVSATMDSFNRWLARGSGPVATLAQQALPIVGRSTLAKQLLVRRALGAVGELPRAAR